MLVRLVLRRIWSNMSYVSRPRFICVFRLGSGHATVRKALSFLPSGLLVSAVRKRIIVENVALAY